MQITIHEWPKDQKEFQDLARDMMKSPEGSAALLMVAFKHYVTDRENGLGMLNVLHGPRPLSTRDQQFIRDRLMDKTYLPDSYFLGARPENNYKADEPLTIEILPDPIPAESDEFRKFHLRSSGADSPRVVTLRRKASGDDWFVWDYPGLLSGIRIPQEEDPWA